MITPRRSSCRSRAWRNTIRTNSALMRQSVVVMPSCSASDGRMSSARGLNRGLIPSLNPWVGVGTLRTAPEPGVAAAVHNRGLGDGGPVAIAVHGAGVAMLAVAVRCDRRIVACDVAGREPRSDQLVCVDRSHDRVSVAVDD